MILFTKAYLLETCFHIPNKYKLSRVLRLDMLRLQYDQFVSLLLDMCYYHCSANALLFLPREHEF